MFESVLVADRGLIACRVMRTCHRLGVKAVTVHSDADRHAMHTRLADEAILLGGTDADESYNDVERLIEAAEVAGAEALHPGRAFVAEEPAAAAAVTAAGLTWIGPGPATLSVRTDAARQAAALAGAELPAAPDGVPADLEVQLLGLGDGQVLVLGTRTVTLQAADRPTVVEAPAAIPDPVRAVAEHAAARFGEAVGLVGLATVDLALTGPQRDVPAFVTSRDRLQIGHSVTELVTGLDLVEQQLSIAADDDPALDPDAFRPGDDPTDGGYAVSARVSAVGTIEPVRIARWHAPDGDGIRVHASYRKGDRLAPYYEPLLAEVAAWGPDRRTARRRLLEALEDFEIDGPAYDAAAVAARLRSAAWLESEARGSGDRHGH